MGKNFVYKAHAFMHIHEQKYKSLIWTVFPRKKWISDFFTYLFNKEKSFDATKDNVKIEYSPRKSYCMAKIVEEPSYRKRRFIIPDRFHVGKLLAEKLRNYMASADSIPLLSPQPFSEVKKFPRFRLGGAGGI